MTSMNNGANETTKQLKQIGKAVIEGLTVFVGFGMLTILYFVMVK